MLTAGCNGRTFAACTVPSKPSQERCRFANRRRETVPRTVQFREQARPLSPVASWACRDPLQLINTTIILLIIACAPPSCRAVAPHSAMKRAVCAVTAGTAGTAVDIRVPRVLVAVLRERYLLQGVRCHGVEILPAVSVCIPPRRKVYHST